MPHEQADFSDFYRHVFLDEHRHPANVALHVAGTFASAIFLANALVAGTPWFGLLYPIVHAGPGLLGHRIFERSGAVGDVRVTRKDFSPLWFIAGNHRMTWELLTKGFYWRSA
jgi:hypothetical protein